MSQLLYRADHTMERQLDEMPESELREMISDMIRNDLYSKSIDSNTTHKT